MVDMADATRTAPAGPGRATPGPARPRRRLRFGPYLLIAPTLVTIGVLLLWPMAQALLMSFQDVGLRQVRGVRPAEWVGLENYREILGDPFFWEVTRNTALFAVAAVSLTLATGTLVGLLLHRLGPRMSTFVATGALISWAAPPVTAAIIFRWLFGDTGGVVNWVLDKLPDALVGGGWIDYSWFSTPLPTFTVLVLTVVWMGFPFIAVSVLAGLKTIPEELYEAARVDGAGPWRVFWQITYPLLRPIFMVLLVLSIIWDFKVFTQLFVLAGPANRDAFMLSLYAYTEAFNTLGGNFDKGSAIAVVLTAMLLIVTAVYVRIMVRQGETR